MQTPRHHGPHQAGPLGSPTSQQQMSRAPPANLPTLGSRPPNTSVSGSATKAVTAAPHAHYDIAASRGAQVQSSAQANAAGLHSIVDFLSLPTCHIFSSSTMVSSLATPEALQRMLDVVRAPASSSIHGGGADDGGDAPLASHLPLSLLLLLLQAISDHLLTSRTHVLSWAGLLRYVEVTRSRAVAERRKILAFLLSPQCVLLRGSAADAGAAHAPRRRELGPRRARAGALA